MPDNNRLNRLELRASLSLALLFFLRMLGLFMLLPVLTLYVTKLDHVTPTRIGLAIGIYALTQAAFQIPMGRLSDKFGRKPIIVSGLLVFVAGSILAALTQNIFFIIAGRALQGCGAISSAALALAADLTRETQRTKTMAIIGVCIGLAFSAAFVVGPLIDGHVGLDGLFWTSAGLGLAGIAVVVGLVPNVPTKTAGEKTNRQPNNGWSKPSTSVIGGFFLHGTLAASFVAIPLHLLHEMNLPSQTHYTVYLPVILVSLVLVAPLVMLSTRTKRQRVFILATIAALVAGLLLLALGDGSLWATYLGLGVFFLGFNYLEAALPSQVSKDADEDKRGQIMGSYATLQFLGTFCGAFLGGIMLEHLGVNFVLIGAAILAFIWLVIAFSSAGEHSKSAPGV